MKNKREVCITTWYGTENYGSNLQAIGLKKSIQDLGFNVSFLGNFNVLPFMFSHPRLLITKIINRINKKKSLAFFSSENYEISEDRRKRLYSFSKKYFVVRKYRKMVDWKNAIKRRTIFACGSDIIWNPARGYPDFRFLDFAYYARLDRFSYASSVGSLYLPKKYYKAYKRYIGSMIAVGVREQSVAKMLEPIIGRKVTQVVDPTLLLTREEWSAFSQNAIISFDVDKRGFVLCYFVMNDVRYWNYVEKIKIETGLQIVVLPMCKSDEDKPYTIVTDGTPYEFTWLIKNADFICTDSFHACVFSIIFEKEFYLLRRKRNSEDAKYDDFLNNYGLEERSVLDESVFRRNKNIQYDIIKEKLAMDRLRSLKYLANTLDACE